MSSKPNWGGESSSSEQDGRFSRLDEMDDLRPLGHEVEVRTGTRATSMTGDEGAGRPAEMSVPSKRIGVKTDVVLNENRRGATSGTKARPSQYLDALSPSV
ncbi:MAG: hypothetical protein Q9164_004346 [Protoblastenia rupestris]